MFTNNWLYDRELVKDLKIKFPETVIIAGGEHANAVPEYCMKQAPVDYIVFGEGEETVSQLVTCIQNGTDTALVDGIVYRMNGEIIRNKKRKRIAQIENISWPAWDLFPLDKYFKHEISYGLYRGRTLPVMATRGCPYECTFCSSPQMMGRKYEMRPASDFVDELEYLNKNYGVVNFDFFDLTAILHKSWIVEMCQEIINRKMQITYQLPSGTRSEAIDKEVAQMLYNSGCKNITYAPESGSERVLKDIKKKIKVNNMLKSIKYSNQVGMNIKLNMIIGFPDETHSDIWATLWFLIKCSWYGAHDTAPGVFSPYPGSELFERLQSEGKIDINSDNYIYEIISSYDLWPQKIYSNKMSATSIKIYTFLLLFSFYASNYIFRPTRFFRTLKNIITKKHESRLEQVLHKNFVSQILKVFNPVTSEDKQREIEVQRQ